MLVFNMVIDGKMELTRWRKSYYKNWKKVHIDTHLIFYVKKTEEEKCFVDHNMSRNFLFSPQQSLITYKLL